MKRLLFISLLFLLSFFSYSQTKVTAPLITNSITDTTYSVTTDSLVRGGYRTLATKSQRDSIPIAERKYGMLVYVSSNDTCYQLKDSSLSNSNWYGFKFSSGKLYTEGTDIKIVGDSINADTTIGNTKLATQGYVLRNIGSTSPDSTYFKNGGNSFGNTAILGTNDLYDVTFNRNGKNYLSLTGSGKIIFGKSAGSSNSFIDTFGNSFLKSVNISNDLQIPIDTVNAIFTPHSPRLSGNKSDNKLYFKTNSVFNTNPTWQRVAMYSDLSSVGNTFSQGVIPIGSIAAIPFYNGVHSISYTNNLFFDTIAVRLGIGTSTPSSALDIHSSTNNMGDFNNSSYTGSSFLLFQKQDTTHWKIGNSYNIGANAFEIQNVYKLNTPISIDTNSRVTFLNNPYVGSNKILNASDSSIAGGYYPYSSNPKNYITLNSLSATINTNSSIFTYNSSTGAYNLDTTKIGTITGVTAGIDLTGGGTSGSVTLNADTTTGSTKLATQGYVSRNSSSGVSLSANNTWTGVQSFNSSVTASSALAIGTNITDTLKAAANSDVTIGLNIAPTFTNSSYTGVKNYSIKAIGDIVIGNTSGTASLYIGRTNFAPASASTQLYRDFGTGNFFINTDAASTTGGGGVFIQTSGTTRFSVDNASTMNLGTASYYGTAITKNGLANTVQYLYGGGGENYTLYRNSSGYQVAIGGDASGSATFYAKGTNANLSATDIKMKIYPSGGLALNNGGTFSDPSNGSLALQTVGAKISIATGTNASVGTATLSSGTAPVSTTAVTANSIILLTLQNCSNCGTPYISAKTAGTSFVISSTNVLDGSIIGYQIIN